jgi:ubiquinol-cytochrome c reductase cytochrome c1 subunit
VRELKVLAVVVFFTLVTYWGVEPLAHSVMHPHVSDADYSFSNVENTDLSSKDVANGKQLVQENCIACHSIEKEGSPAPMDAETSAMSYGVVPPDLSSAGYLYDDKYLAAFIKNPAKASMVEHKFEDGKVHPMPGYGWLGDKAISDMVAYFNSIAPSTMTNKEAFEDACVRCHSMKYDTETTVANGLRALTPEEYITNYMGSTPPDLSMMIRSRGVDYLHKFINEPQKLLEGTAMPRVGLTRDVEEQVVEHMQDVGDSKKDERDNLGIWVLIYTLIFTILAYLWKKRVWSEV